MNMSHNSYKMNMCIIGWEITDSWAFELSEEEFEEQIEFNFTTELDYIRVTDMDGEIRLFLSANEYRDKEKFEPFEISDVMMAEAKKMLEDTLKVPYTDPVFHLLVDVF